MNKEAPVRPRLLLIDDVQDNLEFLTLMLRDKYDVFSYVSCMEARLALLNFKPDLLLLDVRMAPMDGVQFLKEARSRYGLQEVPAIAVTALAHESEKQRLLAAGFQEVVVKPILDFPKFHAMIEAFVKRNAPEEDKRELDGHYPMTA
jgi:CheY-like chemotaxis protein